MISFLLKLMGDPNEKKVKKILGIIDHINALEPEFEKLSDDEYEFLLMSLPPATAQLKKEHFISYLFNHKNEEKFHELFDATFEDISNFNLDVFSVRTGSNEPIKLFEPLSNLVTESGRRADFCRAMIDKLVSFSFEGAFEQKYDFFAAVYEYLIKDFNKDFQAQTEKTWQKVLVKENNL